MFLYKMEENWFKEQAGLKKILVKYRKIPKISPSKNKPPIPWRKKPSVKSPPPPKKKKYIYKPPGGLYLENCPQIQNKTKQKL